MTVTGATGASGEDAVVELLSQLVIRLQSGVEHLGEQWPHLTMQQLRVMSILYNEGATRVSEIARRLEVSTPTVTGILDRLVNRGMTSREDDPQDRRVVLNVLTNSGRDAMERLYSIDEQRARAAIARLNEFQRQTMTDILSRLLAATDAT
jgi:DNA-binding MarR family transcriptional regulator